MKDNRTELQNKFEEQTPTIKGVGRVEYLQTFISWLHLQVERCEGKKLPIHDVSGSFLFDKDLLDKATIKQPEYVIGVDTYDKDALAYCFGRKVDGVFEIMLSKTMRDENEFKQEVENLAKYFNADVFRSGE